jgi:sigma-B regulation protein RsbU (phosphoserine phosphatase)
MDKSLLKLSPPRSVRFPLKLKLLSLMIILIASSLTVFVGIALKIFKEDKSAYIFETLLNKASSEQIILAQKLRSSFPEANSFEIKGNNLQFGSSDPSAILEQELGEDSSFSQAIIIPHQNNFYRWKAGRTEKVEPEEKALFAKIFESSINQGVKEIEVQNERSLYAYSYNPALHFIFVTTLPVDAAFAVTKYLINRSLYYGLFILGAAMFLSVLLARPLTAQLELLFGMTQEIAKGNFIKRVRVKGHDEVGALSDSVNFMADKIVLYMEEMKEKARLENEVAVAQLVQASFFPKALTEEESFKVFGHFEPASECGGDWWGMSTHGDWRIFFIADATGHGVPAALLTATINCCKSSLSFILESKPDLASRPEEILRYMNQAVHAAGEEIQVTCFVASFNTRTREFIYSNASHTPPLLFNNKNEALDKSSFQPLIESNGPRLGQASDSKFNYYKLTLQKHDTIFFYTDGVTEAEDPDGSRWGERRLIKSLIQNGIGSPQEIINGMLADLKTFMSDRPKSDDLTAVALKVHS